MHPESARHPLLATNEHGAQRIHTEVRCLHVIPERTEQRTAAATRVRGQTMVEGWCRSLSARWEDAVCDIRLLQQLHRGCTPDIDLIKEHHQGIESGFRKAWHSRCHVTDNGPQFASAEFAVFARTWTFDHKTSSPTYAQSNGKAENAVKTVERLFKKCKASGQSEYLALLDWRNTPTEGVDTHPAQRLMGRRCKTLLPMAGTLLHPRYDSEGEARALAGTKQRQQFYYNRHAKPLKELSPGETVRMNLPGRERWTPGVCTEKLDNRSYKVKVDNTEYRRNRRHLLKTDEPALAEPADTIVAPASDDNFHLEPGASDEHSFTEPSGPRSSERTKQVLAWHKDYELSRRA